jgi:class 3 adenylate cyclase
VDVPKTRYALSADDTYIAYQVFGEGPDLLVAWPWISHLELFWDEPDVNAWLRALGRFARVITMDQRGLGLSDRMTQTMDLETKVDDVRAVLDATRSERTILYGQGTDGGAICAMFAATYPERTLGLLFWEAQPCGGDQPDYPWAFTTAEIEAARTAIAETWGDEETVAWLLTDAGLPSVAEDPEARARWARLMRNAASRGDALVHERVFDETDFRAILPSIHVPTTILHREGSEVEHEAAEWMTAQIPGARLLQLPGDRDYPPYKGDTAANLRAVEEFLASIHDEQTALDRVLATVLFTDIVDSTATAAVIGDAKWRTLLEEHDRIAKATIARYRGTYQDSTGDGLMATFDGPARAVRAARAIAEAMRSLGIEVRAGIHTGEVTTGKDGKTRGIAVAIGARVSAKAGPSEVLVSQTVKDLVVGSGLAFEDAGEHELKGVPDTWHLYRVAAGS